MLFTSYNFLIFIAILTPIYYLVPKKIQWAVLLAASYLFYLIAGPRYLIFILVTTLTVWLTALRMDRNNENQKAYLKEHKEELSSEQKKAYKESQKKIRLRQFLLCLLLNLGILAVVKYTNFMIANINGVMSVFGADQAKQLSFVTLIVPMGVSFYTFQAIGYLVDVYRGSISAEKNFFRFALFVSFFPQLVQGPISRFEDLSKTLYGEHPFDKKIVSYGLQRILWGYFKKMVIADRIMAAVLTISGDTATYNGAYALVGMFIFTLQLYTDFSGGIDITIGVAEVLGITVQENFCRPFFSKTLKEYWRRWHITMGAWFRDYIFYPLSSSKLIQKFSKFTRKHFKGRLGKRLPMWLCLLVLWLATGIWHGASWAFVAWGLGNCIVLLVSEELEPLYARFHRKVSTDGKLWYKFLEVGRTFLLVCCLNTLLCYEKVSDAFSMFASMFRAHNWNILWDGSLLTLGLSAPDYIILTFGTALLLGVSLIQRRGSVRGRIAARPYPIRFILWYGLFILVLLLGNYGIGYDASQFIYNRF